MRSSASWSQRLPLQTKLLLMLICINLLTVLAYTSYAIYARQQDEIERLDSVLNVAAHAVPGLLAPGVLERERQPQAMSQASACVVMQIKWVWLIFTCSPSSPTARPPT